jgi:hypothetical protein
MSLGQSVKNTGNLRLQHLDLLHEPVRRIDLEWIHNLLVGCGWFGQN